MQLLNEEYHEGNKTSNIYGMLNITVFLYANQTHIKLEKELKRVQIFARLHTNGGFLFLVQNLPSPLIVLNDLLYSPTSV